MNNKGLFQGLELIVNELVEEFGYDKKESKLKITRVIHLLLNIEQKKIPLQCPQD